MRIKNLGKKICIFTIILAMLVSVLFVIIINVLARNKRGERENIGKNEENITTIKATDIYYDTNNYWSKSIIKEIVNENVPVPMGFEHVENEKSELGTIIKNEKDGSYMLWIPYDEKVGTDKVNEYYKKCEYEEMDAETIESIKSYGGFYINIDNKNQYETLKNINESQYKSGKKNAKKIYKEEKQVNSHLIYKEELAQIIAYGNKIGKNFVKVANKEKYEISKLSYGNRKINIQKIANEEVTTGLIATTVNTYTEVGNGGNKKIEVNGSIVTIPEGFDLFTSIDEGSQINDNTLVGETGKLANTAVLKIRDKENKNLVYIWVPVKKKVSELKQNLADYYSRVKNEKEEGLYMYNWEAEDPIETEEYKELVKSIETYGGFYIGESELGYTEDKVVTNRARGMKKHENGNLGVTEGEYYRGNNERSNTYEKMKEIANVYKENKSVVKSHLTYGIEWDAVMEWLVETRKINEEKIALDSSTKVPGAKYESNLSKEIKDIKVEGLNGIYGLAGNLLDITQEVKKYDQTNQEEKVKLDKEYIIGRGGSYKDAGKVEEGGFPIASRQALLEKEIKKENIGFRNCLYIKVNQNDSVEAKDEENKTDPNTSSNLEYKFNSNVPGTAQGDIKVSNLTEEGTLKLFWGDENGILRNYTEFVSMPVKSGVANASIEKSIMIPAEAKNIYGFINDNFDKCVSEYTIPENKKINYNFKYSFGALSDVHYGGGADERFDSILKWYKSKNVSAIMSAGDLLTGDPIKNKSIKEGYLSKLIKSVNTNLQNEIPFYTTKGDHDIDISSTNWNIIMKNQSGCYTVELNGDLFIMADSRERDISVEVIEAIEKTLQENYNKYNKIFLFEHIFLSNTVGEINGNYPKATTWVMSEGTGGDARLRKLCSTYKDKLVWFSGHSHMKYSFCQYNKDMNIYNGGGAYCMMVHISSLLCPRVFDGSDTIKADYSKSEAMLVEVYDNAVVVKAIDAIDNYKCEAYASYIIYY